MLLGIGVQRGYQLRSADVSAAYLQSPREDNVYVEQPTPAERRQMVWKLKKALYGLLKSPLYWHKTVQSAMKKFGLTQSDTDPCIYTHKDLVVGVWVDDFIFGGNPEKQQRFEAFLTTEFTCDAPADVTNFCRIDIDQQDGVLTLRKTRYFDRIMREFNIVP